MAAGFGVENWCVQRGMTKIYRKKNAWGPCLFRQDERMRYTFTKVVPWTWTRVSNLGMLEREKKCRKKKRNDWFWNELNSAFLDTFWCYIRNDFRLYLYIYIGARSGRFTDFSSSRSWTNSTSRSSYKLTFEKSMFSGCPNTLLDRPARHAITHTLGYQVIFVSFGF